MMRTVLIACSLVGAFGEDCSKGYKHKATFTATDVCSKKDTSTSYCNSGCCVKDAQKCGGIAPVACDAGMYWGADGDKVTTTATAKADCCVAVATCATSYGVSATGNPTCGAGWKYDSTKASTKCTGGVATCPSTCCMKDVLKCGGLDVTCASPKLKSSGRRRDAYKNKAATEANKLTDCCAAKATCASAGWTCATGFEKDSTKTATECASQTTYGGYVGGCPATCCKAMVTKCAGHAAVACDATHYNVASENPGKTAAEATKKADCCAVKAKCSAHTCGAGMKKGTATDCTGGATTCESACCVKDPLKCGGLSSITCTATSYREFALSRPSTAGATQTAWDAWANQATKEADKNKLSTANGCCTAKGTCAAFKAAVSSSALVSKTAAQMLPGALLIVVLSALVAF